MDASIFPAFMLCDILMANLHKTDGFISKFVNINVSAAGMKRLISSMACVLLAGILAAQEPLVHDGYEYVDMGLSVMWASYNVGAKKPNGYGNYYAWGETTTKQKYDWSTLKYCSDKRGDTFTKYVNSSSFGQVDDKLRLDEEDDVAHVVWGGDWRMPTKAEMDELVDSCNWRWNVMDGYMGYRVTAKNGNSIFLPAPGFREGIDLVNENLTAEYASCEADPELCSFVYSINVERGDHSVQSFARSDGFVVRAVFTMPVVGTDSIEVE